MTIVNSPEYVKYLISTKGVLKLQNHVESQILDLIREGETVRAEVEAAIHFFSKNLLALTQPYMERAKYLLSTKEVLQIQSDVESEILDIAKDSTLICNSDLQGIVSVMVDKFSAKLLNI